MRIRRLSLLLLLLASCTSNQTFKGECSADKDCPVGAYCKVGICACRTDEACKEGEFCNGQGVCQMREGCVLNSDCDPAKFCDLQTGQCIDRTSCGSDVHCTPGSICDAAMHRCIDGCHDTSDCPLYTVCQKTGTSSTVLGACIRGKCGDKTFCNFRENCINGACVRDQNPARPLCDPCTNMRGECGGARNYCLVNNNYDPRNPAMGSEFFCAPECANENDCPNGYQCSDIVLLPQNVQCTSSAECGGGGRVCAIGEGEARGFCTCATNDECTPPTIDPPTCAGTCTDGLRLCLVDSQCLIPPCDLTQKACTNPPGQSCRMNSDCMPSPYCQSSRPGGPMVCITDGVTRCTTNDDCLCSSGSCINTGRPCNSGTECKLTCQNGGCFLGRACGPDQGLTCAIVH